MLSELRVVNFALMEEVVITFNRGFTVFTGETGAGKSMLIDALSVLLGGRASTDYIRHGTKQARIEGIFTNLPESVRKSLAEAGYELEEEQLFLFREINDSGRNICRIQGRAVPLSLYRSICQGLVDIHGQMEHQSLLNEETHLSLLDAFGGVEHLQKVEEVKQAARQYFAILKNEQELISTQAERQRKEDILRYQIEEIERVNPVVGEEEQLNQEKQLLLNAERIINLVEDCYSALYRGRERQSSAYDLLAQSVKNLQDLARLDPKGQEMLSQTESILYQLEEVVDTVRNYRDRFEFEPGRLDRIEERLIELGKLKKYGLTVQSILELKQQMQEEMELLATLEQQLAKIMAQKEVCLKDFQSKARELSEMRKLLAEKLEAGLYKELRELGFEKGQFKVVFEPYATPDTHGLEHVKFFFSANPGEPLKPLAKVASGGEMSRLMLALKSLFAHVEQVPTFIFDEVDSGVGGLTIQKVGDKLSRIADVKQVICITHSPVVAAQADHHYGITKKVIGERTKTEVHDLNEQERVRELARMLGGEDNITLEHAQALWNQYRTS